MARRQSRWVKRLRRDRLVESAARPSADPGGDPLPLAAQRQVADPGDQWRDQRFPRGIAERLPLAHYSGPVLIDPPKPLVVADFKRGERLYTAAVVNLRRTPGVRDKPVEDIVASLPFNSSVRVVDGPRLGDDLVWWLVTAQVDGRTVQGWSAQALSDEQPLLSREMLVVGDFKAQDTIFTLTTVRLRRSPGFQNKTAEDVLADLPLDVRGTVLAGPRSVDGLTWWQVRAIAAGQEVTGWLAQASSNGTPLVAKAEPTQPPVEPPQPPAPTGKFRISQTVYTGSYVNLRRTPGYVGKTTDDILVEMPYGAAVVVDGGPRRDDDLIWWQVDFNQDGHNLRGWTAEANHAGEELLLEKAPPPPPPVQPPVFDTFHVGDAVCNISLGDVNIRRTPGYRNQPIDDVVALIPSRALLRIKTGPAEADGLHWWQIQGNDSGSPLVGWMAESSPTGIRLLAPAIFRNAIQLSIPFRGAHPVSQLWGDNPDFYKQFTYDGVPLRGHNGIDFSMPIGTPIATSDEGRVLTVGASPAGFGNWVMVDHRWGQSVYAHMNRVTVREGETVRRGDVLGESGNSGTSTGPHLHFSIRITPYYRGDGWGGYCDPLPFMEVEKLIIPAGIRGEEAVEMAPPSAPPIEVPGRRLP
ncbi:MAG: M23 family metallopeptidase [Caldilineaceae bacterium]